LAVFTEGCAVFLVVMGAGAWRLVSDYFALYCSATHSKYAKEVQN